ncbi:Predicted O-linked N-acetylglucosamine transferase, SPINDLY family [Cronobacter malonaticus 507]|nr:Predicted O-linked N-acetylglucosamine transferase, SPINDLY family [Cronobacter malonaticus 507]
MGFMADDEMIAMMTRRLTHFGARPEQLIFRTRTGLIEYLEYHHHIDILLDAFPYTGGTTTNHGAWMGVAWRVSVKIFEPHPQSPDVNPLPALRNGHLTFASFNRPKKINDEVLELWAQILVREPGARLLMGFMADDEMIAMMTRRLTHFARARNSSFSERAPGLSSISNTTITSIFCSTPSRIPAAPPPTTARGWACRRSRSAARRWRGVRALKQ